jgi:DNA mismatch repair protein MutL
LTFAIEQAYHTLLPANRHPLAVVQISLPPEEVDVNVHPTKSEVKFQRRNAVFRAVQRSVREVLIAQAPIPEVQHSTMQWGREGWQERRDVLISAGATQAAMGLVPQRDEGAIQSWFPEAPPEAQKLPPLRVLGQMGQTYIIAEGPEGMYLIDQHAAQSLLEPLAVELTLAQSEELDTWLQSLGRLGFEVEPFGGTTVLVRSVPAFLSRADIRMALTGILDELAVGEKPLADEMDARAAAAACKRGAVKAGQTLSLTEIQALIEQLEQTTSPRTCPHGRPTMILLSQTWMEREFGRR